MFLRRLSRLAAGNRTDARRDYIACFGDSDGFCSVDESESPVCGTEESPSSFLFVDFAFSSLRSNLRAAFFCCFSLRSEAFCLFLNVSICPPCYDSNTQWHDQELARAGSRLNAWHSLRGLHFHKLTCRRFSVEKLLTSFLFVSSHRPSVETGYSSFSLPIEYTFIILWRGQCRHRISIQR